MISLIMDQHVTLDRGARLRRLSSEWMEQRRLATCDADERYVPERCVARLRPRTQIQEPGKRLTRAREIAVLVQEVGVLRERIDSSRKAAVARLQRRESVNFTHVLGVIELGRRSNEAVLDVLAGMVDPAMRARHPDPALRFDAVWRTGARAGIIRDKVRLDVYRSLLVFLGAKRSLS